MSARFSDRRLVRPLHQARNIFQHTPGTPSWKNMALSPEGDKTYIMAVSCEYHYSVFLRDEGTEASRSCASLKVTKSTYARTS